MEYTVNKIGIFHGRNRIQAIANTLRIPNALPDHYFPRKHGAIFAAREQLAEVLEL